MCVKTQQVLMCINQRLSEKKNVYYLITPLEQTFFSDPIRILRHKNKVLMRMLEILHVCCQTKQNSACFNKNRHFLRGTETKSFVWMSGYSPDVFHSSNTLNRSHMTHLGAVGFWVVQAGFWRVRERSIFNPLTPELQLHCWHSFSYCNSSTADVIPVDSEDQLQPLLICSTLHWWRFKQST